MKKLLLVCAALICAFQVQAQTDGSTQTSQSSSTSNAYGGGAGGSGGTSTVSGLQNYVIMTSPEKSVSTVNSNQTGTVTTNLTGGTDSTQRIIQSGESVSRVEYGGTYTLKNVPSVNGPPLTTSNDTCMGSTSGSANGPGFGIGFGTTWTDEHCKDLKTSRELAFGAQASAEGAVPSPAAPGATPVADNAKTPFFAANQSQGSFERLGR